MIRIQITQIDNCGVVQRKTLNIDVKNQTNDICFNQKKKKKKPLKFTKYTFMASTLLSYMCKK